MAERRIVAFAAALAACGLASAVARANVPAPDSVGATVDGSTVKMCGMHSPCERGVVRDGPGGLVALPKHCDEGCVVDECVAPGAYRYGPMTSAYDCYPSVAVTVTAPLAPDCAPQKGPERPSPFAGEAPWAGDELTDSCRAPGYCGRCAAIAGDDLPAGRAAAIASGVLVALAFVARRRRR